MTYLFFDDADRVLFSRDDAEKAEHNHQDMTLYALFPYDPDKVITGGMRVAYLDNLGVYQVFEIITPKTYEPDHYQEITAEHICISELRDELYTAGDLMEKTAAEALEAVLDGTLWEVGNVSATNVSSAAFSYGAVWDDVRTIEKNWNVYITPRLVVTAAGITGRYLDIRPAEPVWRGLRFALEKNMDDAAITWDYSRLKTALYAYGRKSMDVPGSSEKWPWTFAEAEWEEEDGHPAKELGQIYLEDPEATAAYGRNGRPRFGFYQNGDIEDPEKLLELTWQTLKTVNAPDVTIDGQVRDLTKFGAVDVPIRLHDSAQIEITPTGTLLVREVIQYTEDLEEPENSRVTIGRYIPNIVYITKEISKGGGGGGSGGDSYTEYKLKEFETSIGWNDYQIGLKAWQRDLEKTNKDLLLAYAAIGVSSSQIQAIVTGSGVMLDENNNIITDAQGLPVFAPGSSQMWSNITQNADNITAEVSRATAAEGTLSGRITVNAEKVALVVTDTGAIKAASIVAAINDAGSSVTIAADKITLNGQTLVTELSGVKADFSNLTAGTTTATALRATLLAGTTLSVGGTNASFTPISIGSVVSYSGLTSSRTSVDLDHSHSITMTEESGVVTATLGAAVTKSSTARTANFNIADTTFYQNAVSAARAAGRASVTLDDPAWGASAGSSNGFGVTASNGASVTQNVYLTRATSWVSGSRIVYLRTDSTGGTIRAQTTVDLPSSGTWSIAAATGQHYNIPVNVSFTIAGRTFSGSGTI